MKLARVAAVYLIALLCFAWGVAAARYEVFPWRHIYTVTKDVSNFIRGDVEEHTSLFEKLLNDIDIVPGRSIRPYAPSNAASFREVALDGIKSRRNLPRLWISPASPDSFRLIVGVFDFTDALWGAVLLDRSGRVAHRWHMNAQIAELSDTPDVLKNLYGVAFFPDGSAVFNMQEASGGLVKIDVCSRVEWTKKGLFHHVVSPAEDYSAFWTFGGKESVLHPSLLLIDVASGKTIKEIDMAAVEKANPETFIFDLQRVPGTEHATHANDIEPLPAALATAYPRFAAGDLLISYHTTNLIFVLDPNTLKIKWWYVGAGDGQHDPDWHADGSISVFNNNHSADRRGAARNSTIVSIDPKTNSHRTIVDGGRYDFYSRINGHAQFTDYGSVIVTSSTQGRVFEVALASGMLIFEFLNSYDWKAGRTLHLSEALIIDRKRFERWTSARCPMNSARNGESSR